jgi:hypothetical protein
MLSTEVTFLGGRVQDLSQVLWIGGPAASGKTTVGRRLARRNGLRWYSCDTRTWVHRDRAVAAGHLGVLTWAAMSVAERSAADAAGRREDYLSYDRGAMLVDDLLRLPAWPPVLVEGGLVLPRVSGAGPNALWLVPSAKVRLPRLRARGYRPEGVDQALRAGLRIAEQVSSAGGTQLPAEDSVDEVVAEVERRFAGALAGRPGARTSAERRELLRYGNRWIVEQYKAVSWYPRDASAIVKEFDCECARPGCDAVVERTIGSFPAVPGESSALILAAGHEAV